MSNLFLANLRLQLGQYSIGVHDINAFVVLPVFLDFGVSGDGVSQVVNSVIRGILWVLVLLVLLTLTLFDSCLVLEPCNFDRFTLISLLEWISFFIEDSRLSYL